MYYSVSVASFFFLLSWAEKEFILNRRGKIIITVDIENTDIHTCAKKKWFGMIKLEERMKRTEDRW